MNIYVAADKDELLNLSFPDPGSESVVLVAKV
jgi:hypothetical protein